MSAALSLYGFPASERNGSRIRVSVFLPAEGSLDDSASAATHALRAIAYTFALPQPLSLDVSYCHDSDWCLAHRRLFRPQRVGQRFFVTLPSSQATTPLGRIRLRIGAGMAFGTGLHPTTRMCLELLEGTIGGGEQVLDLGTGSGILAIAAAKLGARQVLAIDNDPAALAECERNTDMNNVRRSVQAVCANLVACVSGAPDVLVANLNTALLVRLAGEMGASARPRCAILSGMERDNLPRVLAAWHACDMLPTREKRRRGWAAVRLEAQTPRD